MKAIAVRIDHTEGKGNEGSSKESSPVSRNRRMSPLTLFCPLPSVKNLRSYEFTAYIDVDAAGTERDARRSAKEAARAKGVEWHVRRPVSLSCPPFLVLSLICLIYSKFPWPIWSISSCRVSCPSPPRTPLPSLATLSSLLFALFFYLHIFSICLRSLVGFDLSLPLTRFSSLSSLFSASIRS